jgi:hypothetical protein
MNLNAGRGVTGKERSSIDFTAGAGIKARNQSKRKEGCYFLYKYT